MLCKRWVSASLIATLTLAVTACARTAPHGILTTFNRTDATAVWLDLQMVCGILRIHSPSRKLAKHGFVWGWV